MPGYVKTVNSGGGSLALPGMKSAAPVGGDVAWLPAGTLQRVNRQDVIVAEIDMNVLL
jgi:hypothetical protein